MGQSDILRIPCSNMGHQQVQSAFSEEELRAFMKAILADFHALERMLAEGRIESGIRRIGAEQEMFLVDRAGRPWSGADEMLERLNDPRFTHELARFNLELNLQPRVFGGLCLRAMEAELRSLLTKARDVAAGLDGGIVLTGILPTLRLTDLGLDNMVPNPRYLALNQAMSKLRGGTFDFRIKGLDELELTHDNVMLESCNTSFQIHFQVGAEEFARLYNAAQAITGPVLAAAPNSPLMLGRRLWRETRVALFQQSVDARSQAHQQRGRRPRVHFGDEWVKESVLEIYREDIARFRVVLATESEEDPSAVLDRGEVPTLSALRLHNGTVYRWNRACYGVHDGKAHLRIENRVLPAGPTVMDEVANAAFFFGLMAAVVEDHPAVSEVMLFDHAKENFIAAARLGLQANMTWFQGRELPAERLIVEHLLPMAREGLKHAKVDADDIERYLGVIQGRVMTGQTGARWMVESFQAMGDKGTVDQRLCALTRAIVTRQRCGEPVHTWDSADLSEFDGWRESYLHVGQFMTTDLFTVHPEDVVDLAASLMDWRHIRHVPVEDNRGRLIGVVSHRSLLRLLGQGVLKKSEGPVAVKDIMKTEVITVRPDTPTLEAIERMRTHRVSCLPVVEDEERLVGIITERDLIRVAGMLLEQHLRGGDGG